MAVLVVMGATLQCLPFGSVPSSLIVIPKGLPVNASGRFAATIMDFAPIVNIPTFGMCTSLANPTVAAATAAALGVLTPMPCIPATVTPWTPGALKTRINNFNALTNSSVCNCLWGGVIKVTSPGQFTVQVN
ncbi:DUF4280 domain-containing protein [Crocosphaera sp.]|uniref:DUF4280 domain-containing protein n=1 Tax=Crocosphaera sp. TaxID=2729996 RepID=UPI003F1EC62F|nr:DUF4280 domain-containing protein [Crocosphaera sp.]